MLKPFDELLNQCSESEHSDLLHVFGESISALFPHSEEVTQMRLSDCSQVLIDFVIEAKRGFKIAAGDGDFQAPSGVSIVDVINNEEMCSITPEFSNELAHSFVGFVTRFYGEDGERWNARSILDVNFINIMLRKLDANGNRDQVIRFIKDILVAAWHQFGEEMFRKMKFYNILNAIYSPPKFTQIQAGTFPFSKFHSIRQNSFLKMFLEKFRF